MVGNFDEVFNELYITRSWVATLEEAREAMKVVEDFGIESHVNVFPLDQAPELPAMYMNPHLKGRLVVKMWSSLNRKKVRWGLMRNFA